ncbi:hypothetical protein TELCIR_07095 [Teladorsagia circumcincta]|uniref:Endonuclease/exonuclease/phosphatase domain-containing protein n=1 Tax=Teladorsagia circumcincta TaxID=45464 RepID=A0A2G9UL79_TELCI|nr:hypothetical protein TELCIR_07095 [Teladorsagia circumcincta]
MVKVNSRRQTCPNLLFSSMCCVESFTDIYRPFVDCELIKSSTTAICVEAQQCQSTWEGVGFVLSKRAAEALVGWNPVCDRIITTRFVTRHTHVTVIQIFAPTKDSSDETKNDFYGLLQDTVDNTLKRDLKIVLGDFNAKLGGDRCGSEGTIGPCSPEELSSNGERLISFCEHREMNNLEDEWTAIKGTIQLSAEKVIGRERGKRNEEWIEESTLQKIDERKCAKLKKRTHQKLTGSWKAATRKYNEFNRLVNKLCRHDKSDWLKCKGAEAQYAADHGDSKTL